jgi:MFS family permease
MTASATAVRYSVLALMCLLAMITYIDRAVVSNSKDDILKAVNTSPDDFYLLLVAFQLAYALFEVPTGWMGDVFGPRATLIRVVLWWSCFIGLTGLAGYPLFGNENLVIGFGLLIVIQFLFGMGEAGAFPNITRALYNWFPASARGFAQGAVWMSSRLMGGLTPLIWLLLTDKDFAALNWRVGFGLFAGAAVVWCIVFAWWFRNHPAEHSATNAAERELIAVGKSAHDDGGHSGVPWGRILRSPNLWIICGMYFCLNYGWYFLMYFLPGFMKKEFPAETPGAKIQLMLLIGSPLIIGMLGCFLGGILTDYFVRVLGDRKWGRRICGIVGYFACALCYWGAITALTANASVWVFAVCVMAVGFFNDLTMGSAWATCQDVGRRYAAIVAGFMNMIGNLGAALTNYVTGRIMKAYTPQDIPDAKPELAGVVWCLSLFTLAYVIGGIFWFFINANKPVDEA